MGLVPRELDKLLESRTGKAANNMAYIKDLLARLREANEKAEEASRKWNKLSDYLNAKFADLELYDRTNRRKENIILAGHFDTWHFWQREAVRLASTINAEYHARELLGEL